MKENGNQHFTNLNKCANELSKNTSENRNDNLFSLTLERIAQTEDIPEPEEMNGIDLKQLYSWMANSMAGYPIEIEDGPTKDFLQDCYRVSHHSNTMRKHLLCPSLHCVYVFSS